MKLLCIVNVFEYEFQSIMRQKLKSEMKTY